VPEWDSWSRRLAVRVVPDEAELATDVEFAYAAGGKTRRDLFRAGAVDPGSFGVGATGVGMVLLLPYVLRALDNAHLAVRRFLHNRADKPAHDQAVAEVASGLEPAGRPVEQAAVVATEVLGELSVDPASAVDFLDFLRRSAR